MSEAIKFLENEYEATTNGIEKYKKERKAKEEEPYAITLLLNQT